LLQTDPQDPFNQFWNKLEQVLDNLSQPVAFATIPLTSSVEHKGEDQPLMEPPTTLSTVSKEDPSHRPGLQNETVQAALENQLALALDDDDDFLSGMLWLIVPLRVFLTICPLRFRDG
jgi:hypothetical protein